MQPDRLTVKTQEALAAAQRLAQTRHNSQISPHHLLVALLEQEGGIVVPVLRRAGADPDAVRRKANQALDAAPTVTGETSSPPTPDAALAGLITKADETARGMGDEYVSTEHLLLALAADPKIDAGASAEQLAEAVEGVRGPHRVTDQNPEDRYQALERFGRDLTEAAEQGKLDPVIGRDDEIRRVIQVLSPPHQEQPRAHRRARRGQDRNRRGPGPADRRGRRARLAARPARDRAGHRLADRGRQVPRRVRGPAQGRAQGGLRGRGPGDPVPGRAAHHRGRRRRRGRRGRRQPAQADAGPRRAARGGRHDARRVPQAHREGRRAGAPLPAGAGGRAHGRGHHRHPARAQGALRGPPRRAHSGRRDRGRGHAEPPLHRRPLPARQGHRPDRRVRLAAAHRDRLDARGDRGRGAPHPAARDRAAGAEEGEGRDQRRAPRGHRARAGRPARAVTR